MTKTDRYRRGVGVMLLNSEGKVFVGARIDNPDNAWQMPQAGRTWVSTTRARLQDSLSG